MKVIESYWKDTVLGGAWSSAARGPRWCAALTAAAAPRRRAALHSGPHSGPGRYFSALCVVYGAPRRAGAGRGGRSGSGGGEGGGGGGGAAAVGAAGGAGDGSTDVAGVRRAPV